MTTRPYPYQRRGIKGIAKKFKWRALLGDEMGLGKTPQVLWAIRDYLIPELKKLPINKVGPVVVICPAGIKEQWRREVVKHIGMRAEILSGMKPPKARRQLTKLSSFIYIINYDILGDSRKKTGTWLRWLKKLKPSLVVGDEIHYIQNPKAKRTKAVKELCRGVKRVVFMTGTPITNRVSEIFPCINILRPDKFPSFYSFAFRYCQPRRTPWGWKYDGAARLPELRRKLRRTCMIRRLKKQVLSQLPPKTRTVVPLPIADRKQYNEAVHNFIKWLKKRSRKKAARAASNERLVQMGYLKRLAGELKLMAVIEWIENYFLETKEKLVLFAVHKSIIGKLKEYFGKIAVVVDGSVTGWKRQAAVDKFNTDDSCRLFIGNIKAAGVGWSCYSTSTVAFAEISWTPDTQAEDRIHGVGRGKKDKRAQIYYLVAQGTIEEVLCKMQQRKQQIQDQALDEDGMGAGFDVFDQLEKLILQGGVDEKAAQKTSHQRRPLHSGNVSGREAAVQSHRRTAGRQHARRH